MPNGLFLLTCSRFKIELKIKNTTGAGDVFIAGFIYGLVKKLNLS